MPMTLNRQMLLGALVLACHPWIALGQYQTPPATAPLAITDPLPALPAVPPPSCKEKFCQSPLGQLTNNLLAPARQLSGGVVPDCCAAAMQAGELTRAGAVTLLSPAEMAAAKIKADEAGAQSRRTAVRYLAGKDCTYYPEAEFGLVAALRADRSECVRYEAALALAGGCCCTRNVAQALSITVGGGDQDGNPCEISERVKTAAWQALHRCQASGISVGEPVPATPIAPDAKPMPKGVHQHKPGSLQLTSYTQPADSRAPATGAATEAERRFAASVGATPARVPSRPAAPRSLLDLFTSAASSHPVAGPSAPAPAPLRPIGLTPIGSAP